MSPTVKAVMEHDADGIQVRITNLESLKEAIYRVDKSLSIGNNVLYRVDMKPTTRQHRLIEGDPEQWITDNIDQLANSVM